MAELGLRGCPLVSLVTTAGAALQLWGTGFSGQGAGPRGVCDSWVLGVRASWVLGVRASRVLDMQASVVVALEPEL